MPVIRYAPSQPIIPNRTACMVDQQPSHIVLPRCGTVNQQSSPNPTPRLSSANHLTPNLNEGRMRKRLSKFKAKALPIFRQSGERDLSVDPEPAAAETLRAGGGQSTQESPAHTSTSQGPAPSKSQTRSAEGSTAPSPVAQYAIAQKQITQALSAPESVVPQPRDVSIRELWDVSALIMTFTIGFCRQYD